MTPAVRISCPHCGEVFSLALDAGEGDAEFTVDCEVCCRPMTVRLAFDDDGELATCDIAPE